MLTYRLIALFVDVPECLDERLVEPFVGADVLHAKSLGYSGQTFELDDGTVLAHLLYLFAIFNVDVRRCVLLVVLDSETVTWWWALAAETLHLRGDFLHTIIAFLSFAIGLYWRFKFRNKYLAMELEEIRELNEQLKSLTPDPSSKDRGEYTSSAENSRVKK